MIACEHCCTPFQPSRHDQKYCRKACKKRAGETRRLARRQAEGQYKPTMPDLAKRKARMVILIERDNNTCGECGFKVAPKERTEGHIIPVSHGGSDDLNNLQLEHRICNERKGNQCPGCDFCLSQQYSA